MIPKERCQAKDPSTCSHHAPKAKTNSAKPLKSVDDVFIQFDAIIEERRLKDSQGIHWSQAGNPRLAMLAKRRAYRVTDKSIDVYYGSRGNTVILRHIDEGAKATFLHGACASLAYSMHIRSGLPFAVFTDKRSTKDHWEGHVGLLTEDGQILDILGKRSPKEAVSSFKGMDGSYVVMDTNEFKELLIPKEHHKNPMKMHDELEQLVVADFADYVLSENKIPVKASTAKK
jgi:hypothetical protein